MRNKSKKKEIENSISGNNSHGSDNLEVSVENYNSSCGKPTERNSKKRKGDMRFTFSSKKIGKEREAKEKEFKERESRSRETKDRDKELDNGGAVQYEVEAVVDEKVMKGVKHYLIRWKGYDSDDDTWEPKETVNCADLIKQFHANRRGKLNTKLKRKISDKLRKAKKDKSGEEQFWDENEEFEINRIIEVYHKRDGKREFFVSWKGYPPSQNSWVLEEDMTCVDLMKRFMDKVERARDVDQKDLRIKRAHTDRFTLSTRETGRRLSKRNVGKQRVQYHDAE